MSITPAASRDICTTPLHLSICIVRDSRRRSTTMPLITTPKGLRYYRFSDRTKRIWQYRLENGHWARLPKPVRISDGYDDQYTFGISHLSDPLKEPVVSITPCFPYSVGNRKRLIAKSIRSPFSLAADSSPCSSSSGPSTKPLPVKSLSQTPFRNWRAGAFRLSCLIRLQLLTLLPVFGESNGRF